MVINLVEIRDIEQFAVYIKETQMILDKMRRIEDIEQKLIYHVNQIIGVQKAANAVLRRLDKRFQIMEEKLKIKTS